MNCPVPACGGSFVEAGETPKALYWRCGRCHSLFIVTKKNYARMNP